TTTGTFGIGRLAKMSDPAGTTDYRYERRGLLREEHRAFMTPPSSPPPTGDDGRDSAGTTPCGAGDPEPLVGKLSGDGRIPAPGPLHQATTKFTYDRDGNRASIAYPSTQLMVDYTFDFAGRPLTASGVITSAKYLPFGPLTELKFANSTTQTMQYDARYRMTRNDLTIDGVNGNSGEIARYLIGYDPASNITSINDGKDSEYNRQFEYDDLHRLTKANTGAALWRKGDYQWDAMGNIVRAQLTEVIPGGPENLSAGNPKKFKPTDRPKSKKDLLRAGIQPLGRIMSFSYDETTPVVTAVTLNDLCRPVRHDEAGNETAYAVTRSYWPRNLLASVSDSFNSEDPVPHTVAYSYDGRGVRAIRTEFPTNGPDTSARRYYVYTPELQLLSATRDDATNVWEPDADPNPSFANNAHYEIIWFGNRPVAQFNPGSFTRFTFADHLGTPILQTDTAASIAWRVEYEPFGSIYEVRDGQRVEQPLRFPGQELAMTWEGPEENANVFRWYKTSWGRYTQSDPIGFNGGTNLYAYVGGNPINASDPLGLKAELVCRAVKPGGWAGAVIGVVGFYTHFKPLHCRLRVTCPCSDGKGDPKAPFDKTVGWENITGKGLTLTQDEYLAAGYDDGFFGPWFSVPVQSKASGCDFERCALSLHKNMGSNLPPYNIMGPNSNSYVNHLIKSCGGSANLPPAALGGSPNPWYGGGGFN
ncbi:MAG TPA: RHS repeat-associated core domain-containing protein, partial [Thermoanaerobaculia bacterium]|nr:RHS repeat-associated core domain-containing protein [Thermoanaerobaculia bacterium]